MALNSFHRSFSGDDRPDTAAGKARYKIHDGLKFYINKIHKDQQKMNAKARRLRKWSAGNSQRAFSRLKSASHLDIFATLCSIGSKNAAQAIFCLKVLPATDPMPVSSR
jgi:hypothetical protein